MSHSRRLDSLTRSWELRVALLIRPFPQDQLFSSTFLIRNFKSLKIMPKYTWSSNRPRHFYRLPKEFKQKRFCKYQPGCFITTGATDWFTGSTHLNSYLVSCLLGAEHRQDTNPANTFFEIVVKYKHVGRILILFTRFNLLKPDTYFTYHQL